MGFLPGNQQLPSGWWRHKSGPNWFCTSLRTTLHSTGTVSLARIEEPLKSSFTCVLGTTWLYFFDSRALLTRLLSNSKGKLWTRAGQTYSPFALLQTLLWIFLTTRQMQRKFHSWGHPDTLPLFVLSLAGLKPAASYLLPLIPIGWDDWVSPQAQHSARFRTN